MPIDYLSAYNKNSQAVKDLLASKYQTIPSQLQSTRSRALAAREPTNAMAQNLASQIDPSYGSAVSAAISDRTPMLNRQLDATLRQQQYDQMGDVLDRGMQQQMQMQQNSYGNVAASNDFARQYLANQKYNQWSAAEAEKQRQAQLYQADLARQYANIGVAQQIQNQNNVMDPTGSYLRVLLGIPAAMGTAYALNKYGSQQQTQPGDYMSSYRPSSSNLNSSYYQPYGQPMGQQQTYAQRLGGY